MNMLNIGWNKITSIKTFVSITQDKPRSIKCYIYITLFKYSLTSIQNTISLKFWSFIQNNSESKEFLWGKVLRMFSFIFKIPSPWSDDEKSAIFLFDKQSAMVDQTLSRIKFMALFGIEPCFLCFHETCVFAKWRKITGMSFECFISEIGGYNLS